MFCLSSWVTFPFLSRNCEGVDWGVRIEVGEAGRKRRRRNCGQDVKENYYKKNLKKKEKFWKLWLLGFLCYHIVTSVIIQILHSFEMVSRHFKGVNMPIDLRAPLGIGPLSCLWILVPERCSARQLLEGRSLAFQCLLLLRDRPVISLHGVRAQQNVSEYSIYPDGN